jgi:phosphatidylethanolamine/phosphatidyl-N-methylethanolamine N-methyltransferase
VLRQRFPGARILAGDALELDALLSGERFGAVVSSLPLKIFSASDVVRLANSIHALLGPGGCWIQYTYQVLDGHPPTDAFRRVASDLVLLNLPPARVCVFQPVARSI